MKAVINTVIFQIACIILFTLIYFKMINIFRSQQTDQDNEKIDILDLISCRKNN